MAIGQIQVKVRETLIRSHDLTIGGIYFFLYYGTPSTHCGWHGDDKMSGGN